MTRKRQHLYFIRASMAFETSDYYEQVTDVWVLGDVQSYAYFRHCVAQAKKATANLHLDDIDTRSNSMRVVILPAANLPRKSPRLKIIERLICIDGKFQMELVFHGNASGYDRLAEAVRSVTVGSSYDHTHVDQSEGYVVQRSVALNIRGPLKVWNRSKLGDQAYMIYDRQPTYLPPDINHLDPDHWPYEEVSASARAVSLRK